MTFIHIWPGDIMGTALQNLNQLVQMPSGCGEQNMVLFAPIIYVLQYLERTNQLSEELKTKAVGYLQSGVLPFSSLASSVAKTSYSFGPLTFPHNLDA